VLDGLVYTYLF